MHRRSLMAGALMVLSGALAAAVPVGSVAVYSDGDVEKLIESTAQRKVWEDDRKRRYVRSVNPILPVLERKDFLSGRGYRQTVVKGQPDSLDSLNPGRHVEFSIQRVTHDGHTSVREWDCQYLGKRQESVLSKGRMVQRYSCERFTIHRKLHNRVFRERREISYSEELGLVVDLNRTTTKKKTSRKLVALLPPKSASYKKVSALVRELRKGQ